MNISHSSEATTGFPILSRDSDKVVKVIIDTEFLQRGAWYLIHHYEHYQLEKASSEYKVLTRFTTSSCRLLVCTYT